jgi:hypothetical protein
MPTAPRDFSTIRNKLKLGTLETKQRLLSEQGHIPSQLLNKSLEISKLRAHSSKILTAGAMTSAFLLAAPQLDKTLPPPQEILQKLRTDSKTIPLVSSQKVLVDALHEVLPQKTRPLTRDEEKTLEQLFQDVMGVKAKATLEGEHLNTTYGLIGAEQHLPRYPGDNMSSQLASGNTTASLASIGMTPGRGAWGYFAPSKQALTPQLDETEKWYAVVQTLYLPDWNTRTRYLRDWYKYRKVVIVNTVNGNAVVAAIADAGPAAWTGKHFGGSPEVMLALGGPKYKKGAVVVFFLDDPDNKVPLGPIEYNKIDLPEWAFHQI